MRLIDAEALKDDGANYVWSRCADGSLIKKEIRFVNREQIDNAPTVDAVPIEWIMEWFNTKMRNALLPRNYELICNWIIHDWEAENG